MIDSEIIAAPPINSHNKVAGLIRFRKNHYSRRRSVNDKSRGIICQPVISPWDYPVATWGSRGCGCLHGRGGDIIPLHGRERAVRELDLLARRSERAHKDEGQLALIVGEPGLGKSRLMEEFHARLGGTPHTWVEWSSSQLLQNTPLHAITEWGLQRFGLNAPAEQRLADLEDLFS
jgi:hypothetical protein